MTRLVPRLPFGYPKNPDTAEPDKDASLLQRLRQGGLRSPLKARASSTVALPPRQTVPDTSLIAANVTTTGSIDKPREDAVEEPPHHLSDASTTRPMLPPELIQQVAGVLVSDGANKTLLNLSLVSKPDHAAISPQHEQAKLLHAIAMGDPSSSKQIRSFLVNGSNHVGVNGLDAPLRSEPLAALLKAAWKMEDKKERNASLVQLHKTIHAMPPGPAEAALTLSAGDIVSSRQAKVLLGRAGRPGTIPSLPAQNQAQPLAALYVAAKDRDRFLLPQERRDICKLILPMVDSLGPEHANNFMSHVLSGHCADPHLEELLDPALPGSLASMPQDQQVTHLRVLVVGLGALTTEDLSLLAKHINTLPPDVRQKIGTPELITPLVDSYLDVPTRDVGRRQRNEQLRRLILPLVGSQQAKHVDQVISRILSERIPYAHLDELFDPSLHGSIPSMPHERQVKHLRTLIDKAWQLAPRDIQLLARHLNTLPNDIRKASGETSQLVSTIVDAFDAGRIDNHDLNTHLVAVAKETASIASTLECLRGIKAAGGRFNNRICGDLIVDKSLYGGNSGDTLDAYAYLRNQGVQFTPGVYERLVEMCEEAGLDSAKKSIQEDARRQPS